MPAPVALFRFGAFEADLRSKELRRSGVKLRLPLQSFAILTMLLERPGELISRNELQETLWPEKTFVDFDHGLNAAMSRLRDALGDSSGVPRFIETLPRRGYRFIGEVRTVNEELSVEPALHGSSTLDAANSATTLAPEAGPWWRSKVASAIAAVLVLVILSTLLGWWPHSTRAGNSAVPTLRPLTTFPRREISPSFSPDGGQVVFAWDGEGAAPDQFDLYTKVIGSESLLRLTSSPSDWLVPAWSPDGRTIAFLRVSGNDSGLFSIAANGGPERKLVSAKFQYPDVLTLSWSPDGRQLAFPNTDWSGTQKFPAGIRIMSMETGNVESIPNPPECKFTLSPAFSPDGKWLAFSCALFDGVAAYYYMPRIGGKPRQVITIKGNPCPVIWNPDSNRLVVWRDYSLWEIGKDGGELTPIPFTQDANQVAASLRGNWLAFTRGYDSVNLWTVELPTGDKPDIRQILTSTRGQWEADISPNGNRLAFGSDRSGGSEVWVSKIDGSNLVQLTSWRAMSGSPRWSPTGNRIAFDSRESGKSAIYTVDPDSPRPRKVPVSVDDASVPTWSRDGQFLYFTCTKGQQPGIYRTSSASTGEDKLISSTVGANVQEAQDGTLYFASAMVGGEIRTLVANGNGEEQPVPNMPRVLYPNDWVLASKGIYFIDRKQPQASIRFFAFSTRKVQTVLNLNKEPAIWGGIALAPDERQLIYAQVDDKISDIMLLENFK